MKKKNIMIYIIIAILIISILGIIIYTIHENGVEPKEIITKKYTKGNFYKVELEEQYDDIDIILTTKEQYLEIFGEENPAYDFDNYNYALFQQMINQCGESNITPYGYRVDGNYLNIRIDYEAKCGLCAIEYEYYLLELPKTIHDKEINQVPNALNDPDCPRDVAYKPIIYLYPEEETNITIKLGNPHLLTTTYPKYNDSWNVTAYPDGTIKYNNREYYSLFWEGKNHPAKIEEDGFIVEGKDTEKFLEEKLNILGLTDKEANEFIIYWLPKLENNKYNYIRFETLEEINNYMPLDINPKPETIIRVQMDYKLLDKKIKVKEQKLIKQERKGYSLIEWGGSQIS